MPTIKGNRQLIHQVWQLINKNWNSTPIEDIKTWCNGWDAIHSVDIPNLVEHDYIKDTAWSYADVKGVIYKLLETI